MSAAAACAPTRIGIGMRTFAELMPPPLPPPPPPPKPQAVAGGAEGCVDAQLWLACAGSMCTVPPVGAAVYYFPQGHAEQASAAVDLSATRVPTFVACRVAAVRFMAETETDDIFARIRLVPLRPGEPVADAGDAVARERSGDDGRQQQPPKPASFAKNLTVSDANNGGGFSVPRFCAETIFPELDYRATPPVQSVCARDVHGVEWTFRHIYRGTPRRHLLTTGWSNFVNKKKLMAGDSVVFLRGEDGGLHVGVRRVRRGFCGAGTCGADEGALPGWADICGSPARSNAIASSGAAARASNGKVRPEDVVSAATQAAAGQPFEVVYYPRARLPEFCVRAAVVRASMQVPWCNGLRFKMAFETEDSSRISWFMGTIAGVQPADPVRYPQSPWRLLQVAWDEPELLQNVKRVCPWLVEQVSSMPNLHMPPPFSSPRKKTRLPPYNEFQKLFDPAFPPSHAPLPLPLAPNHDQQSHHHHHGGSGFIIPSFPFPDSSAAAGIQGARQAQFAPIFPDLHVRDLQQSLLFYGLRPAAGHQSSPPAPRISTDLTIGSPPPRSPSAGANKRKADDSDDVKEPLGIMLFGRAILTEEQLKKINSPTSPRATKNGSSSGSGSDVTLGSPPSSSWRSPWSGDSNSPSEFGLEPGQCKVFVESDAVGRNLDLSALGSLEELYARLSGMFCIDNADLRSHVLYLTAAGEMKHVGDEPFSSLVKSARKITILSDAGSDNTGDQ